MKKDGSSTGAGERISGDLFGYFLLHNTISVLFFFFITISLGIYSDRYATDGYSWMQVFGYVINPDFWQLTFFQIFPISVLSSLAGRITAYYGIKGYYKYVDRNREVKRSMKRWSELNTKINRMGIKFLITGMITSFFFTVGLVSLLSYYVFDEKTLLPLMVIYSVLKITVYFSVRWLVGSKL